MVRLYEERARQAATRDPERQASLAIMETLRPFATPGSVEQALERLAQNATGEFLLEVQASRKLHTRDDPPGLLNKWQVLGPFRDTGGGLARSEGPEPAAFRDGGAKYPWGAYDVSWRKVSPGYIDGRGIPLGLLIAPRKESCTYLATQISLPARTTFVLRVASAGQVRILFDGATVAEDESVHPGMFFDRLAVSIDAQPGAHVIALKVCSGALDDSGRVRARITAPDGTPMSLGEKDDLSNLPNPFPASKHQRLPVALDHSLADKSLFGAVVMTAGFADDLRSQRGPGLLDSATLGASADDLAIASAISKDGSSRSGWRSQALVSADARVSAFVSTQEILGRSELRYGDWALMGLSSSPHKTGESAYSHFVRAMVWKAIGDDAASFKSFGELKAAFDAAPAALPKIALDEFLVKASTLNRKIAAEGAKEWMRRGEPGVYPFLVISPSLATKERAALADAAMASDLSSPEDAAQVLRDVSASGDYAHVRALLERALFIAPNSWDLWSFASEEFARTGEMKRSQQALGRARELSPSDPTLRAKWEIRSQESEVRSDERFLHPTAAILARRKGVAASQPTCADRQLHWQRVVTMQNDGRVSQLIHYAKEIVIAPRTQEELYEELPTEGEKTEIVRARVHRRDGGIAYPSEERNDPVRPQVRWPDLRPGDTVEVVVRSWTRSVGGRADSPFYFLDYGGSMASHPLLFNEVIVRYPKDRPIFVGVQHGGDFLRAERDENGLHIIKVTWERPPVYPEEPLAPALSEVAPLLVGSTYPSWEAFRTWYRGAVSGFTEPDAQVRRLAAELTRKETTRDGKIRALFNFVADGIRYVNYVSGEWWLPNRPQELLARREGDCDDKAILLIALLKSIGIEAEEVLVQTRMTNMPSVLRMPGVAAALFDHGIAYLPGPNGGTYLDATSPQSRLGSLPSMDARASALRLNGPAEIVKLPDANADAHGSRSTWSITLADDGSGTLDAREEHFGDSAFWLRTNLREEGSRESYVENSFLAGYFSGIKLDAKIAFEPEQKNGSASLRYRAKGVTPESFARKEMDDWIVSVDGNSSLSALYAPLTKRTLPVELPHSLAPSTQSRTFRIRPPTGYSAPYLPEGGQEAGAGFGSVSLRLRREGSEIVIDRTVVFAASHVSVEDYDTFRNWLLRADALLHRRIRFTKQGGAR